MSVDVLLLESKQYVVFKDICTLILEEETRAKKILASSAMLLDGVRKVQKILTVRYNA